MTVRRKVVIARKRNPARKRLPAVKFQEFKDSLFHLNNSIGEFFLLPDRKKMFWAINPNNWNSHLKHIKTEGRRGHKGSRKDESMQVVVNKPRGKLKRTLLFKPAQIPNYRFQELFGLVRFRREARIVTETPIGLCKIDNTWYTITLREQGETLKLIGDKANGSVLDAARLFGKAFNAGLLQNDAGVKHVLASGKRLRLFDLEFATRARNKQEGLRDFRAFFVSAVEEGLIQDRKKALVVITAFCEVTGLEKRSVTKLAKDALLQRIKFEEEFKIKSNWLSNIFERKHPPLEEIARSLGTN